MAPSSENPVAAEHMLPPTAPALEMPTDGLPEKPDVSDAELRERADAMSRQWEMVPASAKSDGLSKRLETLKQRLAEVLRTCKKTASIHELTPELELLESTRMLESALIAGDNTAETFASLPHVRVDKDSELPRAINLTEGYLVAAKGIWSDDSLTVYVQQAQRRDALLLEEITVLPQALKLAQLEYILDRAEEAFAAGPLPPIERSPFSAILHSMRRLNQFEWRNVLEPLIAFDSILREDPASVFSHMEDETRHTYHLRVAELAKHADSSEVETAQIALKLAREAAVISDPDPRLAHRTRHIGYYLFADGLPLLSRRIGYHPPPIERIRSVIRRFNEDFYILGIFTLSCLLIVAIIAPLVPHHAFWPVMVALLLALLPATQGGVDLINNTVTALMHAESLPKIDLSKGIPDDAITLVVVPTLLLNEIQVRELFDELEARYLSNQDPNLHFGLLTDLPDTKARPLDEDANPLAELAVQCVDHLNAKYPRAKGGAFFLLHRYRVFNSRQGVWMGWERKRGKLLDLNKFLLNEFDSFPLKAGPLEVLQHVRYVITLDSDTQLPRGTAARMVGTMAHPLNQAIVNPRLRIVTQGYGILQPRVGVSVASASRSRLASLYSGETGFDIYTRAVSDVYQDLFGEGIFAGKGIYEVDILHQTLDRRFPRNALLSHDLIEGSYARAGLVTDIEIIDDYPSHYSAHTRRKHRWVRGDWQIAQWLFASVPDESGKSVPNPINTISRWKIFDNLRRSLVEPVTFLLFLLGWFVLPGGALYWTAAGLLLLLLPVLVQLGFNLGRALLKFSFVGAREGFFTFATSFGFTMLNLTFLPHHMFLAIDAIIRSLSRTLVSGKHMLEWETAAQAESGKSSTPLDIYLQLSPVVALLVAVLLAFKSIWSLVAASPVLVLWAVAPLVAIWLNLPPRREEGPLSAEDHHFLQQQALHIWRYFHDFGDEKNHWLIPDNVEELNTLQIRKLSPTNLGMLFNARQAAYEFGLLTLPEFAEATLGTLNTYDRLEKQRGHIYNWYDIETLQAIPPFTVSAVDSGNLAASLYTLHTGALDLLKRPLLSPDTFASLKQMQRAASVKIALALTPAETPAAAIRGHLRSLSQQTAPLPPTDLSKLSGEEWITHEVSTRLAALSRFAEQYTPWLLPKFEALFVPPQLDGAEHKAIHTLLDAAGYVTELESKLSGTSRDLPTDSALAASAAELLALLPATRERLDQLKADINAIAAEAERHADAMEYGFLLVESRQLLSIGYDGVTHELHSACYDLLASEARIASFIAVAKGDIPQQSWFRLDRSHVLVNGRAALLSWTGTMFEYMMPSLWMRTFPDTLIARSLESAVRIQRDHVHNIPWGISESGFSKKDPQGRYGYQAWGMPKLALKYGAEDGPVISPYSSFLALPLLRKDAITNLRRMAAMDWSGAYGFYEAADYTQGNQPELVRSWMAHHQGMCLLALTNLLKNNIVQDWFHGTPRVRAAELLLHEKALSKETLKDLSKQSKLQADE
ncbi:glucoamylase family protein [Granulicella sp. S190]|uniref:glucoamylase family protein n=1 Tax=Granulicella sp. S190 TaxID=1747226 RepID=UPI00131C6834|nr:glucoamylase family protein [Granulicella sp. S190]